MLSKIIMAVLMVFSLAASSEPYIPDDKVTPGEINPGVTQANIKETICVSGWTGTIRPPSSYTNRLKERQLSTTYSDYRSGDLSDFEEDHRVPLSIGGHPTDEKNLWPEPWCEKKKPCAEGTLGARKKDVLEREVQRRVCSGKITLRQGQEIFLKDWTKTYHDWKADKK